MSEANVVLRRSYAHMFAQAALASAENEIDRIGHMSSLGVTLPQERSHLHPLVPFHLDSILALVVLTIYEYCQRGNVSRMRARINQAVTTAMDMSLHELGLTTTEYSEAQRRAWWMTPPVITAEDQRITTPFPQFDMHLEVSYYLQN
ncbi:Tetratricopeptide-like helical [Penicillium lagena]|uniref:Tetratricopeptide-like helical n=1 Tax=Penicillium lagena TaxID=94218 RepID=UPI00253FE337|nr:Tetratricopeptide-like helical [Penicillium lagena]KAJ5606482.1 Tetratricopeptide-like helical [Penicillium lagena]